MTETGGRRRWYVLAVLLLVYLSNQIDRQILTILLEPIKAEFLLTDTQLGFLSSVAFALFYTTLGIPVAMWADRGCRRCIVALALTVWSACTVLCGAANSFGQLLAARIGVAIGESGGSPPAHSMIADLFGPMERGFAMAVYALGVPIGILLGLFIGGIVATELGWRAAFVVVGAPGLLLSLIFILTVREPSRPPPVQHAAAPPLRVALRFIVSQRSLAHVLVGSAITSFVGYGVSTWLPSYFVRSYGLQLREVGFSLGPIIGLGGVAGTLLAGYLADRLGRVDRRWMVRVVSVAIAAAVPFAVAVYLAGSASAALALYCVPAIVAVIYLAPSFALSQTLVAPRMRAVSSGFLLFTLNLIGLGLGPLAVGVASDLLEPRFGAESLRYALLGLVTLNLWAAAHYWWAGRSLERDMARADAQVGSGILTQ